MCAYSFFKSDAEFVFIFEPKTFRFTNGQISFGIDANGYPIDKFNDRLAGFFITRNQALKCSTMRQHLDLK